MERPPRPLFLIPGALAVLCAPVVLLAERYDWPEAPVHATQILATLMCAPAAALHLLRLRRRRARQPEAPAPWRRLAWVALVLSSGWLAFFTFVVLAVSFSGL